MQVLGYLHYRPRASSDTENKQKKRTKSAFLQLGPGILSCDVEGAHYTVNGVDITSKLMEERMTLAQNYWHFTNISNLL
jgi:hypothetical protein